MVGGAAAPKHGNDLQTEAHAAVSAPSGGSRRSVRTGSVGERCTSSETELLEAASRRCVVAIRSRRMTLRRGPEDLWPEDPAREDICVLRQCVLTGRRALAQRTGLASRIEPAEHPVGDPASQATQRDVRDCGDLHRLGQRLQKVREGSPSMARPRVTARGSA